MLPVRKPSNFPLRSRTLATAVIAEKLPSYYVCYVLYDEAFKSRKHGLFCVDVVSNSESFGHVRSSAAERFVLAVGSKQVPRTSARRQIN